MFADVNYRSDRAKSKHEAQDRLLQIKRSFKDKGNQMKFSKLVTSIGLTVGSVLFVSNSAQAVSFKTNFTQENGTRGDVFLNSIEQNGTTINQFSFVERVVIVDNDPHTTKNTGAASTDHGDDVTGVKRRENLREGNVSDQQNIVDFMGNNNLNKIIDTEDKGSFTIDFFFDSFIQEDNSGLDSLFFWERNMNSDLNIQAIASDGSLLNDTIVELRRKVNQTDAGFSINTKEIGGDQKVGSWGVSLAQLGVTNLKGIRVSTEGKSFNGPDFKVIARSSSGPKLARAAKVPEPGTIIALGSVAALAFIRRRKSK
jgi:hypothetical protein